MSFPVIGAAPAVPIHQYTKTITASDWTAGVITIPKSEHKLDEPVVSVQKVSSTGKHKHVTVGSIETDDTSKAVIVTIPQGAEFAGKIIIN